MGLDVSAYRILVPDIKIAFIDPRWQSTYAMFNRLKTSPLLYNRYSQYEDILFYELDAWVFRDELEYWSKQGYDYIGAPWFDEFEKVIENSTFVGVGNGGFSFRKQNSSIRILMKVRF